MKRVLLFFLVFVCCSTNDNQDVSLKTVDLNDDSSTTTIDDTSTTTSISITTTTTLPVTTTTSSTTTTSLPTTVSSIEEAQILLKNLGIYTGEIDGINGSLTKKAIREFQKLAGLVIDGVLGPNTINALINGENSYIDIGGGDVEISKTVYSEEIENAQLKLKELNLYTGAIDGINGIGTKNAIREFQKLAGLVVDGVLGPITSSALEKGKDSYVKTTNDNSTTTQSDPVTPVDSTNENFTVDLRNYNPNADCINGYVNDSQVWVPDPCFYPVFVYRYGQIAQVNSQAELDAYLSQNWSLTKEKTYSSLGEVPT